MTLDNERPCVPPHNSPAPGTPDAANTTDTINKTDTAAQSIALPGKPEAPGDPGAPATASPMELATETTSETKSASAMPEEFSQERSEPSSPASATAEVSSADAATTSSQNAPFALDNTDGAVAGDAAILSEAASCEKSDPEQVTPPPHEAAAPLSVDLPNEDLPPRYVEAHTKAASTPGKKTPSADSKPSMLLEPGPADRLYQALSWAGLPVLLALAALMCISELLTVRTLWFSDEVRHADVYMRLLGGDWLTLNLNGVPYPDKPPLYFWFLRALDFLPGVDAPMLFFLGTALSAVLFVGSTWLLARATGHDRRVAFAAGLLTLGCLFFGGLAHYPRMDLLFAAVIALSLVCLYRGWIKTSAPLWLTLGFVLAGVATLIKGPLALAFPILSSILFLIVRGTPGRLNARDGLPGFALMLLLLLAWVAALYWNGQADYLREIFGPQIAGRMVNAWHHAAPWWYYLAALPLLCLPWTFLVLFINWKAAVKALPGAWKRRREEGGRLWLWIITASGFLLLSALSGKIAIYLLPLLSPLAVLAARALLNLTPRRSRWFFLTVGLVFGLAGVVFLLAEAAPWVMPWLPESWTTSLPAIARAYLDSVSGLVWMGLVLLGFAVLLVRFTRRSVPGGALLVASLGTVCLMQPYSMVVAPSLDVMLSPRNQSEAMAKYVAEGYFPAAYRVYPGIYAYYLNDELVRLGYVQPVGTPEPQNTTAMTESATPQRPTVSVLDLGDREALDALLAAHPRIVLALRESDWNKWTDRPADVQMVQRQWIVDQPYVLAVKESVEANVPTLSEITESEQDAEQMGAVPGGPEASPEASPENVNELPTASQTTESQSPAIPGNTSGSMTDNPAGDPHGGTTDSPDVQPEASDSAANQPMEPDSPADQPAASDDKDRAPAGETLAPKEEAVFL